jgi:hypothetical protein
VIHVIPTVPDLGTLVISPPRKRALKPSPSMIGFTALQTRYDGSKHEDDQWVLVTLEQPKKLWVSEWYEDDKSSGWLGTGWSKVAFKV